MKNHRYNNNYNTTTNRPPATTTLAAIISTSSTTQRPATTTATKNHPSYRYVSTPMLCEFLYKEELTLQQSSSSPAVAVTEASTKGGGEGPHVEEEGVHEKVTTTTLVDGSMVPTAVPTTTTTTLSTTYTEYCHNYCLRYIRTFFNQHHINDNDIWFQYMYNPYHIYTTILLPRYDYYNNNNNTNRTTTASEFLSLKQTLQTASSSSLFVLLSSSSSHRNNDEPSPSPSPPQQQTEQEFNDWMDTHIRLSERRYGNTTTTTTTTTTSETINNSVDGITTGSTTKMTPTTTNNNTLLETPKAHLFSFQQAATTNTGTGSTQIGSECTIPTTAALHIMDIPSYMTDAHIMISLQEKLTLQYEAAEAAKNASTNADTTTMTNNNKETTTNPTTTIQLPQLQIWPSQQLQYSNKKKMIRHNYPRDIIVTGPNDTIHGIVRHLKHTAQQAALAATTTPSSSLLLSNSSNGKNSKVSTALSPDRTDIPRKHLQQQQQQEYGIGRNNNTTFGSFPQQNQYRMGVECGDLYGRTLYDKDGRGNCTFNEDEMEQPIIQDKDYVPPTTIPPRICDVMVSILPIHNLTSTTTGTTTTPPTTNTATMATSQNNRYSAHQPRHRGWNDNNNNNSTINSSTIHATTKNVTVTLSAALSSTERIEYDTYAAYQIAMALDDLYNVPEGYRLHDLFNDESICHTKLWTYQASDKLDFIIAYLRRIHLFSYYNGCCFVNHSLCDVVTGKNAVSTIHVRMKNADQFLQELQPQQEDATMVPSTGSNNQDNDSDPSLTMTSNDDNVGVKSPPVTTKKDLLVQRLDDAIAKALHEYCGITEPGDTYNMDDTINNQLTIAAKRQAQLVADVAAIQDKMNLVQEKWLSDHANMADGRARCSFTFCTKLFKDSTFLYKHLLKKHSEYLHAEQRTCHDDHLMKIWDAIDVRPVPDILVDCGTLFGTVACPVIGATPTCIDPEPELWRKELERRHRVEEMKIRRSEVRNQQHPHNSVAASTAASDQYQQQQQQQQRSRPAAPPSSSSRANFIDVDDMKVEKVELSFDNIMVPDVVLAAVGSSKTNITNKKKKRKLL